MKVCPCGQEEVRTLVRGRWATNIDPVSGLCLACLVGRAAPKQMPAAPVERDWAKAAAGDDE